MFTIGDFAKYGRVSVRMLRHYDAIGLLPPARVDAASGYRFYDAAQLARLNRIVALKDLGLRLDQIRSILDEQVSAEQLRGMLRLRRSELESELNDTAIRLRQVEARLRTIESEGAMPSKDVVLKALPPLRVVQVTGVAASYEPEDITPVINPLYERLCELLSKADVRPVGPGLARYADAPDGGIVVHAALPVSDEVTEVAGAEILVLPEVPHAATILHQGDMNEVLPTAQALARWIEANGYVSAGYAREVSLHVPENRADWVIELQEPVVPAAERTDRRDG
ncbi:MAG TPA: MerR family transcriptional regulator [Pseudonocardiaceae bacterium]|nr:MerR family transcriptional regulator [Pseudonocardiaceae bacterium]